MRKETLIGVDIGGTKISAARICSAKIKKQTICKNPSQEDEQVVLNTVIKSIEGLWSLDVAGIGIGVPSLVDSKNGIVFNVTNIPSWKEVHLKTKLEEYFNIPVFVENDANCYAVGEKYFGRGKGFNTIAAITLGTGIGVGLILNGSLYSGANGGGGEFCRLKYKEHDLEYYCGSRFFKQEYNIDGGALSKRAEKGDVEALRVFNEYGGHVGEAIYSILCAFDPEIIILGGSISKSFEFFKNGILEVIDKYPVERVKKNIKIVKGHDSSSAILGAAALFYNSINSVSK